MKRFNYWCVVLCAALGNRGVSGAVDALFGRVLLWITAFRDAHVWMLAPFLALAGLAIVFLYAKISPPSQRGWAWCLTRHGTGRHRFRRC